MVSMLESAELRLDRNSLYAYKLILEKALATGCRPEEYTKLNNLKHALDIVMQRILENENTEHWSN